MDCDLLKFPALFVSTIMISLIYFSPLIHISPIGIFPFLLWTRIDWQAKISSSSIVYTSHLAPPCICGIIPHWLTPVNYSYMGYQYQCLMHTIAIVALFTLTMTIILLYVLQPTTSIMSIFLFTLFKLIYMYPKYKDLTCS